MQGGIVSFGFDIAGGDGVFGMQVFEGGEAGAGVGAEVGVVGFREDAAEAFEDDGFGGVGIDLGACGGDKVVAAFLGGADLGLELLGLVFEGLVAVELLLDGGGLGIKGFEVVAALFLGGEFGLGAEFLELGLEVLHLAAGEDAGVVAVLIVLLIGGGKQGGEFGDTEAFGFEIC